MPLSNDPEKRARSLANLKRGRSSPGSSEPAPKPSSDLPVVDYSDTPEPTPKPDPKPVKKAPPKAAPVAPAPLPVETEDEAMPWVVIGGGVVALVLLVVILNRTGGRPNA